MNYNICLIKPEGYIHSLAFLELAELIFYSLNELGHHATIQFNKTETHSKNILIGCHLLEPGLIPQIPASTIILNTEQIFSDTTVWSSNIFEWVKHFEVWDYSDRNIEKLAELGIKNIKHLKLGYQKELSRIQKSDVQDIDVLFYGSLNERRQKIINDLKARGLKVHSVFGTYGPPRDKLIARSKVVLNHHFYKAEIFEIVRAFYLMTNSVAIVSEVNQTTSIDPIYLAAIAPAPYGNLVDCCEKIVSDDSLRRKLESDAFQAIARFPQSHFTASII